MCVCVCASAPVPTVHHVICDIDYYSNCGAATIEYQCIGERILFILHVNYVFVLLLLCGYYCYCCCSTIVICIGVFHRLFVAFTVFLFEIPPIQLTGVCM